MRVIPCGRGQARELGAIGSDRVDVEIIIGQPAEDDPISPRRPMGKVVVAGGERVNCAVRKVQNPKPPGRVAPEAVDDALATRLEARETGVARPGRERSHIGAVSPHHHQLRGSRPREKVVAHTKDDPLPVRGPLGRECGAWRLEEPAGVVGPVRVPHRERRAVIGPAAAGPFADEQLTAVG